MPTARRGGSVPTTGLQRAACAALASTHPNPAPRNVRRARLAAIASGRLASVLCARPAVIALRKHVCLVQVEGILLLLVPPPVPCAWQALLLRIRLPSVLRVRWATIVAMDLRSAL